MPESVNSMSDVAGLNISGKVRLSSPMKVVTTLIEILARCRTQRHQENGQYEFDEVQTHPHLF
jgi:hypothetical protein